MNIGIKMDKKDNVAVIIQSVSAGDEIVIDESMTVKAIQNIPMGHKIAIDEVEKGENIIKYGVAIGRAEVKILKGEHVHVHNVLDITGELNAVLD